MMNMTRQTLNNYDMVERTDYSGDNGFVSIKVFVEKETQDKYVEIWYNGYKRYDFKVDKGV